MLLTRDNMILAKYASKWVVNIYTSCQSIDKSFILCAIDLIGDEKELLDYILDAIITEKTGEHYPEDIRFYENWCYLPAYSVQTAMQNLVRLVKKYPLAAPIVGSVILGALSENVNKIKADIRGHSIFRNLYFQIELTKIEYEFILLLYAILNYPKIANFIKNYTTIMRDDSQLSTILGVERRKAKEAEKKLIELGLMGYKGGKLNISSQLIKF